MSVKLRKKKLSGSKISLYLDIYLNGQRQYDFLNLYLYKGASSRIKATNKDTLELAETIRANRQTELQYSEHDIIPRFKRNADFVEYFKTVGESKGRSSMIWKSTLKHLEEFTGGQVAFKIMNERWLEKWQNFLIEKVSRNTAAGHYAKTASALKLAVRDKIIQRNPCDSITNIKLEEIEREYLNFEEIKQLSKTIPVTENAKEVARMFLFGCFTGLSFANLVTLTFKQIEGNTVKFFREKTKTWHHVPLNETALSLIGDTASCDPQGRIFNTLKQRQCSYILEKWGKQAGIKKHLHMHLSRHTFATLSLSSGADLYTVSKLLGHKKLTTTQIYAKVIDEKKSQAVNNLPRLEL